MIPFLTLELESNNLFRQCSDQFESDLSLVEKELELLVKSSVEFVDQIGSYTLRAGGKRLRPALVLMACRATGNEEAIHRAIRLGAALEAVHMATLIHDDVVDRSHFRRGKPTVASSFGKPESILSGDVLLAKAMKTLVEEGDLEIIKIVSQSMVEIAEGEALELQVRGNFLLSKEEYLRILRMKTASFMECCCQVGALIGNITKEHQGLLGRYGHHIGMAFQIIDDLLDFKGHQSTTGKPRATDFREGCVTLPLIYLRSKMKKEESFFISKLFGNGALEEDIQVIHEWMEEREVYAETERYALSHVQKAQEFLQKFPDSPYKELMMQTSQAILNRQQ